MIVFSRALPPDQPPIGVRHLIETDRVFDQTRQRAFQRFQQPRRLGELVAESGTAAQFQLPLHHGDRIDRRGATRDADQGDPRRWTDQANQHIEHGGDTGRLDGAIDRLAAADRGDRSRIEIDRDRAGLALHEIPSRRLPLGEEHRAETEMLQEKAGEAANRAGARHQHRLTRRRIGAADRVQRHGERLAQGRDLRRNGGIDLEQSTHRQDHLFRKATVADLTDIAELGAKIGAAGLAWLAHAAWRP